MVATIMKIFLLNLRLRKKISILAGLRAPSSQKFHHFLIFQINIHDFPFSVTSQKFPSCLPVAETRRVGAFFINSVFYAPQIMRYFSHPRKPIIPQPEFTFLWDFFVFLQILQCFLHSCVPSVFTFFHPSRPPPPGQCNKI